jgi:hypothetical protein
LTGLQETTGVVFSFGVMAGAFEQEAGDPVLHKEGARVELVAVLGGEGECVLIIGHFGKVHNL